MIATLTTASITSLTPIPLTASANGYSLTIADSQPIIPPGSSGLAIEVEGTEVAQESNQTISVEGTEIAAGSSTGYTITVTCKSPNGTADFASLTVSDLPAGVTATVQLNTAEATSTITFYVATSATAGTYTYTITAIIDDWYGSFGPTPPDGIQNVTLTPSQNTPPTSSGAFTLNVADFVGKIPVTQTPYFTLYALPVGYSPTISLGTHTTSADVSVDIAYTIDVGAPIVVHLPLNPAIPPGLYTATIMGYAGDDSATISVDLLVTGPVLQSAPIALYPTLTIGPAWPPPQVITSDGVITLSTDQYAFSINQGDTVTIGIYAVGFSAYSGYWNFFFFEESPENVEVSPYLGQGLWFISPSNNTPVSITPSDDTPTLITNVTLTTTLVTPPGVYAFTIADEPPTLNPNYMTLTQTGTPTNTGKFRIYLGSTPGISGNPPYIFCNVFIESIDGWFDWVTLTTSEPPGITVAPPDGSQSKGGWTIQITPDADLPPGTYVINLTGTNGSDYATLQFTLTIVSTSSPFNGVNSATIHVQIMDVGGEQATAPSSLLSGTLTNPLSVSRRAQTGLVATSHQGRQVFRALVIPTNRRTPPQLGSRARHVSITIAQALQTDEVLEAWSVAAGVFPGHDQIPEKIISHVGFSTFYNPMTPKQFQYLCQSTQMAFGNEPTTLPAPVKSPYALAPDWTVPWYPQAMSMSANAVYDKSYKCVGFILAYGYLPSGTDFGGYSDQYHAPDGWIVSATSASASSVSSKSGSGFAVLGYYIGVPETDQLLTDWIAVYGDLPPKGTIYFSMRPADPFVGVTGMLMTTRCSFNNGTLQGIIKPRYDYRGITGVPAWQGPLFYQLALSSLSPPIVESSSLHVTMTPGSSLSFDSTIRAYPAVAGGGWNGGEPYSGTVTFKHTASNTAGALPAGTTITVDHDSIVIAPGDTTDHFILWTITLPPGVGFTIDGCLVYLEATDGLSTSSLSIHINGA